MGLSIERFLEQIVFEPLEAIGITLFEITKMFLSTVNQSEQFGWIEVICGSMFSGKLKAHSSLKRAQIAYKIRNFKPAIDTAMTMNWSLR